MNFFFFLISLKNDFIDKNLSQFNLSLSLVFLMFYFLHLFVFHKQKKIKRTNEQTNRTIQDNECDFLIQFHKIILHG